MPADRRRRPRTRSRRDLRRRLRSDRPGAGLQPLRGERRAEYEFRLLGRGAGSSARRTAAVGDSTPEAGLERPAPRTFVVPAYGASSICPRRQLRAPCARRRPRHHGLGLHRRLRPRPRRPARRPRRRPTGLGGRGPAPGSRSTPTRSLDEARDDLGRARAAIDLIAATADREDFGAVRARTPMPAPRWSPQLGDAGADRDRPPPPRALRRRRLPRRPRRRGRSRSAPASSRVCRHLRRADRRRGAAVARAGPRARSRVLED